MTDLQAHIKSKGLTIKEVAKIIKLNPSHLLKSIEDNTIHETDISKILKLQNKEYYKQLK